MKQVIFTVGISASGKSTWAKKLQDTKPGVVIIERDMIRKEILKAEDIDWSWDNWKWPKEKKVSAIWDEWFENAMVDESVRTIVCADTNLNRNRLESKIARLKKTFGEFEFEFVFFRSSFDEAVSRDNRREHGVGYSVIAHQLDQFNQNWYGWRTVSQIQKEADCPEKAIIVDIDGTLAHIGGRSPYDYSKLGGDRPDEFLSLMCRSVNNDISIIILTGRPEKHNQATKDWLNRHKIPFNLLIMRPDDDNRKDVMYKEDAYWDQVHPYYDVIGVFEDRPINVRMWNAIGLRCFAAGNPFIEF